MKTLGSVVYHGLNDYKCTKGRSNFNKYNLDL